MATNAPPLQKSVAFLDGALTIHFLLQFFNDVIWVLATSTGRPGTLLLSSSVDESSAGFPLGGPTFIPDEAVAGDAEQQRHAELGERLVDVDTLLGPRDDPLVNIVSAALSSAFARYGFRQQLLMSLSFGIAARDLPFEQRKAFVFSVVGNIVALAAQAMHQ